mgnify:CR=1 FL=1
MKKDKKKIYKKRSQSDPVVFKDLKRQEKFPVNHKVGILLGLIAFLLYSNTINFTYVLDDSAAIVDEPPACSPPRWTPTAACVSSRPFPDSCGSRTSFPTAAPERAPMLDLDRRAHRGVASREPHPGARDEWNPAVRGRIG